MRLVACRFLDIRCISRQHESRRKSPSRVVTAVEIMSWKSNALTTSQVYDPATLSSMTTVLETSEPSHSSKIFPPFDWQLKDVKSAAGGVSLDVRLNRTSYSANDSVAGKLFIICPRKCPKLKIGKIEIRLFGFEGARALTHLTIRNISRKKTLTESSIL